MTLPPLRPGHAASAELLARRAALPSAWTAAMLAPGVTARNVSYGDVPCLVCEPAQPQGALLYLHGGGYRLGSPAAWAALASRLAASAQSTVIVPDYRLSPEHPFPAALYDALAVYKALTATNGTPPIVGGDSAGGGLGAALALACRSESVEQPRGLVLCSPWLDLTVSARSYESRADTMFPKPAAQEAATLYLQGHSAVDPFASPLNGELRGFPPTLLFASADECLLDDTLAFQRRLAEVKARVETRIIPGMPHAWPTTAPGSDETSRTIATIARFVASIG